jgi:ATP-binding cassette, subfamily B, bacterial
MLIATEPWLGLLALTPVPFLVGGAVWYTVTAKSRYAGQRKAASAMNALLHDNLAGVRQIKAYAREEAEHERFDRAGGKLKDATLVVMKAWAIYDPSMTCDCDCVRRKRRVTWADGCRGIGRQPDSCAFPL